MLHEHFQPSGQVLVEAEAPLLDVDADALDRCEVVLPVAAALALADSLCGHGRLLAQALQQPMATRAAIASVSRGVVEAGVRLWYLSTAEDREERTRRFLLDHIHDLEEEARLFSGVAGERQAKALAEVERVRQLKQAAQSEALASGHKRPSSMELLDVIMGSPGAGVTVAGRRAPPANLPAPATTSGGQAPARPGGRSGRRQVWFVVEADGRNDQAPVVVLSRHTTQPAAKAALAEACSRRPAREPGEVLEVRSAD